MIYNEANFNQSAGDITEFVDRAFSSDIGSLWSAKHPVSTNTSSHFFDQCAEVDDAIFEARHLHGPQDGQYFFQQVSRSQRFYSIATFVNASSPASAMTFTGYAL